MKRLMKRWFPRVSEGFWRFLVDDHWWSLGRTWRTWGLADKDLHGRCGRLRHGEAEGAAGWQCGPRLGLALAALDLLFFQIWIPDFCSHRFSQILTDLFTLFTIFTAWQLRWAWGQWNASHFGCFQVHWGPMLFDYAFSENGLLAYKVRLWSWT